MAIPVEPLRQRHILVEVWIEKRELCKALLGDACMFLLLLTLLFIAYPIIHALKWVNMSAPRVARFETVHYWMYFIVFVAFLADLLFTVVYNIVLTQSRRIRASVERI